MCIRESNHSRFSNHFFCRYTYGHMALLWLVLTFRHAIIKVPLPHTFGLCHLLYSMVGRTCHFSHAKFIFSWPTLKTFSLKFTMNRQEFMMSMPRITSSTMPATSIWYLNLRPVSYTHLDVYKRQILYNGNKIKTQFTNQPTTQDLSLIHIQMCIRDRTQSATASL